MIVCCQFKIQPQSTDVYSMVSITLKLANTTVAISYIIKTHDKSRGQEEAGRT